MSPFFIIIAIILIGAIVYLNVNGSFNQKQSRDHYLREMAKFLEGTLEPMGDQEDSFRINFRHAGLDYSYEDIRQPGFKDQICKAYLKAKTNSQLNLYFVEKERKKVIAQDMLAEKRQEPSHVVSSMNIKLPKELSEFSVSTNDVHLANAFLEDSKVTGAIAKYKNVGQRGYPHISFSIIDGVFILEFREQVNYNPSLIPLRQNYAAIEGHVQKLAFLASKLCQ